MQVHTELSDDNLDDQHPDPNYEPDGPCTAIVTSVVSTTGQRRHAQVSDLGDATADEVAEALVRCAFATAGLHSPAAAAALAKRFVEPNEQTEAP